MFANAELAYASISEESGFCASKTGTFFSHACNVLWQLNKGAQLVNGRF